MNSDPKPRPMIATRTFFDMRVAPENEMRIIAVSSEAAGARSPPPGAGPPMIKVPRRAGPAMSFCADLLKCFTEAVRRASSDDPTQDSGDDVQVMRPVRWLSKPCLLL